MFYSKAKFVQWT